MIGTSLFKKGGVLLFVAVLLATLLPTILPAPQVSALSAKDCRSDQYFVNKSGTKDDECVNKADKPRNAADCPSGTTFKAGSGGDAASCLTPEQSAKNDAPDLSCKVVAFNPLNWFVCPVIGGLRIVIGQLDETITSMLSVGTPDSGSTDEVQGDNPSQIFCDNPSDNNVSTPKKSCSAYYKAWATVRNIALGLMVIAGLIVVIAQALGMELLDAYTIRKVLPRLLIAAVAITLSWQLMRFFVVLTNDLGYGVRTLMFAPFSGLPDANLNTGSKLVLTALEGAAFVALGALGLLSFVGTAVLSLLIAFFILVIRQLAIIILIIFAPIAIVAYILPNTQNIYKVWWDSFAKALIMFPLISAFIAAGHILAVVAGLGSGNPVAQITGFAAYFAPYFMLPLTYRFAGGFLRNAGGFVNDRSRGGFDRLRNFRGAQTKQNLTRAQQMRRFSTDKGGVQGYINRRANSAVSALTDPASAGKIYGGMALRKAGINSNAGLGLLSQLQQGKFQHSQKLAEQLNTYGFNDRALSTLMGMSDFSAGSIIAEGKRLSQSSNANDRIAGNLLQNGAGFLSQVYKDEEMGRADIGIAAGLANTAQGFSSIPEVTELANRRAAMGDEGVAAAFVTQAQLNGQRAGRLDMKPGYGVQMGSDGRYFSTGFETDGEGNIKEEKLPPRDSNDFKRAAAHQAKRILSTGQSELQGAKAPSVKAMSPGFEQILKEAGPVQTTGKNAGKHVITYQNEQGKPEELAFTPAERERVASMLGNAQSQYAGTSAQTSAAIDSVVASTGLNDTSNPLNRFYDGAKRGPMDPSKRGGEAPPDEH